MPSEKQIRQTLWILMLLSVAVRAFVAGFIELGNDEVYYWTYAKFPDLSHFDHPPMVGWMIQLFTLNLHFSSEFFLRLASLVCGTASTYLIYLVGKTLKDPLTGLYAAFLFTASFYTFIISGTFIMPDTPQVLFWLLTIYFLLRSLPDRSLSGSSRRFLLAAGFTAGLALLSKYHSAFLLGGVFLYIIFFNRAWLRAKETYIAFATSILLFIPVIAWNWQNSFISFTYHESRVSSTFTNVRWDFLGKEVFGQIFYNNPVNVIIILLAFLGLVRGRKFLEKDRLWFLLFMSAPLALIIITFSLFDSTLPHWTGPAYLGFILIAAAFLREGNRKKEASWLIPWPIRTALFLTVILVAGGVTQIKLGWLPFGRYKTGDFSAQLYGWRQLGEKFSPVVKNDIERRIMPSGSPLITFRWFPAANFDYYAATPVNMNVYALGTLTRIHKYYWIDKKHGNLPKGSSAYYMGLSDDFQDPSDLYGKLFDTILPPDTIHIYRGKELIRDAYVYRLYGLKKEISFNNVNDFTEPSEKRIQFWENEIRTHPLWMNQITEKAKKQRRTVKDQIYQEAKWAAEREMME